MNPVPQQIRPGYAECLWVVERCPDPEVKRQLVQVERDWGEDWVGIRARRNLVGRAVSVSQLAEWLDIFALWPGQQELRKCAGMLAASRERNAVVRKG